MNPIVRGILLILFGIAIAFSFMSFFSAKDAPKEETKTAFVISGELQHSNLPPITITTEKQG
ncbi:hypothetical protein [Megamonas hypermegale]|uniref:hypothetical protein n=1 Tax=Megamonas hypermegale TaxID=158847 RepID=UPI001956D454|nr:hypothetical protein [Megamonas hypermegale]MBM6833701.1 hypothetical protein [Megamonas hypermegale]